MKNVLRHIYIRLAFSNVYEMIMLISVSNIMHHQEILNVSISPGTRDGFSCVYGIGFFPFFCSILNVIQRMNVASPPDKQVLLPPHSIACRETHRPFRS